MTNPTTPSPMREAVVPFELRGNLVVVEVALNGVATPMLLDTGAAASAISFEAAERAGVGGVEKIAGVGVGGAAEMAIGRLNELRLGEVAVRDLTIALMDLTEIRERLGGEVGGVLGFDLFGAGRLEIDYPARTVRLALPEVESDEGLAIEGGRIRSARWRFGLDHPGGEWTLVERPPLPHTKLLARHPSGAEIEIVVAEAHGLGLDQLRLSVEASLPLQVESFRLLAAGTVSAAGRDWLEHRFEGVEAGRPWRYLCRSTATSSTILTATVSAPRESWPELERSLVAVVDGLTLAGD